MTPWHTPDIEPCAAVNCKQGEQNIFVDFNPKMLAPEPTAAAAVTAFALPLATFSLVLTNVCTNLQAQPNVATNFGFHR